MDLSTIIDALVKASEQLQMKSSQNFSLDRTLGSVASITLTLGLYRVLKSAGGRLSNSGVLDLVKICLTSLLIGDGVKKRLLNFEDGAADGGGYVKRLTGSCHCKSVSFVLKARRTVEAKDCDGKIRYPHYTTNADDFQLISGARNLSVYYVNLAENTKGHVIAAHTFCSKCGVHILRAPNSNSKRLEVNTNCLDDKRDVKEIRVEGDLSGMSLSSGNALENRQRSPRPASIHEDHAENSLWMQDEDFLQSMSRDTSKLIDQIGPGTPATLSSSTLLPSGGSVFSAASSIADDYDDVSTLRSSEAPSTIHSHYNMRSSSMSVNAADDHYITRNSSMSVGAADTYYKTRSPSMGANNSDAASIRTWAVGSDNSISPHSASILPPSASSDGISLPSMPFDKRPNVPKRAPPSSAVMKEQLQYYMKKHLVSSKSADADSMEETKDLTEGIST